jgi:uncharacterized protein (TIGR02118 family)
VIRFSVYSPDGEGATFDHDYYRDSHIPLCCETWGLEGAEIDRGMTGPYVAAVHFLFDSQEAMHQALAVEGTAAVINDVANYTNITPVQQISEVVSQSGS